MPNPPHQANNPAVTELPVTSSAKEVAEIIRRDGGVIIKNFISTDTVAQIDREIAPHWQRKGVYKGNLFNAEDPPLSGLCGKSPTVAEKALNHPLYQAVSKELLRDVTYPWWGDSRSICISDPILAVSQAFTRGPKTPGQPLHRDDMPQHFEHEEGSGDSSLLGLLVAGTKCTFENGATQLIVGSHKWGDDRGPADPALCSTAEMETGDALLIIGSIWHGAGENISLERRNIYSVHMVRGTLRQDENQYLAIPKDVAKTYSAEVQAIIGYSVSQPYCGYVEMDDPAKLLKENAGFEHHDLQGIIFEGPGSENFKGEKPRLVTVG
ncbi:PhyH-domain-containing protein [Aspergillus campestris IBT 28561]|uniref:PhyH-domain-containing protein n=1 Tax=Aspergillus campestris (strain IBT 28561) TaxID=1392248 RepID=A0A2I1D1Z5_ASPC2|nr:PhyH-domain-containing protein [Aspergillus campestris IBT 28561]PKY03900.1 PhyH-domain-containing protein [Aspergillus campestris IBT 28561]